MTNLPTKKELLELLLQKDGVFMKHLTTNFKEGSWSINAKLKARPGDDGEFYADLDENPAFKNEIQRIVGEAVRWVLSALIDTIASPEEKYVTTTEDVDILKKRVARLEAELFKLLPSDFTSPSSDSPFDN